MNWITIGIAGGVLHWMYRRGKWIKGQQGAPRHREAPKPAVDPVQKALDADDLDQLMAVVDLAQQPVEQHLVLSRIIDQAYRARTDAAMRQILLENGWRYLNGFPSLSTALKAELGDNFYHIPVFKQMAIALDEDGDYDAAIAVCRTAIEYEMDDGTKTGYEGRVARIQKKQATP